MGPLYVVIRRESAFQYFHEVRTQTSLIGRGEECAIRLQDIRVSRRHAKLQIQAGSHLIQDLGSRNGTLLHGRRIKSQTVLNNGAEIQIGPFQLLFCQSVWEAVRGGLMSDASTQSHDNSEGRKNPREDIIKELTPAQVRVYDLLLEGLLEKEVALQLGISIHTVHDHVKAIYRALSVTSRGELISKHWQGGKTTDDSAIESRP